MLRLERPLRIDRPISVIAIAFICVSMLCENVDDVNMITTAPRSTLPLAILKKCSLAEAHAFVDYKGILA